MCAINLQAVHATAAWHTDEQVATVTANRAAVLESVTRKQNDDARVASHARELAITYEAQVKQLEQMLDDESRFSRLLLMVPLYSLHSHLQIHVRTFDACTQAAGGDAGGAL
eukprot:SAG11_NODE_107_length_16392_cov_18.393666_4_plen_112_part_00